MNDKSVHLIALGANIFVMGPDGLPRIMDDPLFAKHHVEHGLYAANKDEVLFHFSALKGIINISVGTELTQAQLDNFLSYSVNHGKGLPMQIENCPSENLERLEKVLKTYELIQSA